MEEFLGGEVRAGFPSPGISWRERPLMLQELVIRNPDATHYFRVKGHSMRDTGIIERDVLVVDRALNAEAGDIVVVALGGRHLVKRLEYVGEQKDHMLLCSAHPDYPPIFVTQEMQAEIWGVVIAVVRQLPRRKRRSRKQDEQK